MSFSQEMSSSRDPSDFSKDTRSKAKGMKFSGKPRFSISCSDKTVTMEIVDQIKRLEGEVSENSFYFDETCTHIVCHRPNRGEKVLAGIASGKWILGLKYIQDSAEAGYFLDEETYEWGNPQAINLPNLQFAEQIIADAAFKWRTKASRNAPKAFQGLNVVLHVMRPEKFTTLIRAGGGDVIDVAVPYWKSYEALNASHCIVDDERKLDPKDHEALTNASVPIVSDMYLHGLLVCRATPTHHMYLLRLDSL